jgi:hypothetical protein
MAGTTTQDPALLAKLAPYAASVAGAIVSLAFIERLTVRGRCLAFFVGLSTSIFLGPALAYWFFGEEAPPKLETAVLFITGVCAMGGLPIALKRLETIIGDPWSLLKAPRFRIVREPPPETSPPPPIAKDDQP